MLCSLCALPSFGLNVVTDGEERACLSVHSDDCKSEFCSWTVVSYQTIDDQTHHWLCSVCYSRPLLFRNTTWDFFVFSELSPGGDFHMKNGSVSKIMNSLYMWLMTIMYTMYVQLLSIHWDPIELLPKI